MSKTIDLAGQTSQLYQTFQKYQLFIERVVEEFQRDDPPSVPQLEVPVTLFHKAYTDGLVSPDPFIRRNGCLIIVSFYFLVRFGEYTKPKTSIQNGKRVSATCTKQFVVDNVGFFQKRRTNAIQLTIGRALHGKACRSKIFR